MDQSDELSGIPAGERDAQPAAVAVETIAERDPSTLQLSLGLQAVAGAQDRIERDFELVALQLQLQRNEGRCLNIDGLQKLDHQCAIGGIGEKVRESAARSAMPNIAQDGIQGLRSPVVKEGR